MKLSKKTFLISLLIVLCGGVLFLVFFFLNRSKDSFNPISDKNNFYNQLNLAIKTSQLETSSWQVRDFLHQVEFTIPNGNNNLKVILSDQKSPIWQIASLQELIKTAKINNQSIKLVDLSTAHPYATFKNN